MSAVPPAFECLIDSPSFPPQNFDQLRIGFADDEGHPGLGNPRLLAGDQLQRIAQVFHVVALDLGDRADQRPHHVGAVEPSAQAYLDDSDLGAPGRKISETPARW